MTSSGLHTLGMETSMRRLFLVFINHPNRYFTKTWNCHVRLFLQTSHTQNGMFSEPLGLFLMGPELLESLKCDQGHEIRSKIELLLWCLQSQSRNTGITDQFRHEVNRSKSVEGRQYFVGQQDAMWPRCPVSSTSIFVWYRNLYPQQCSQDQNWLVWLVPQCFHMFSFSQDDKALHWYWQSFSLDLMFLQSNALICTFVDSRSGLTCVVVAIKGLHGWAYAHFSSILPDPQLLDAPRRDSINWRIDFLGCWKAKTS